MSNSSLASVQLDLLTHSKCVRELYNVHRITRTKFCNTCVPVNLRSQCDTVYRHFTALGNNIRTVNCATCSRTLGQIRPSHFCQTCFGISIDFLSAQTHAELTTLDAGTAPALIAIEHRCSPLYFV